MSILQAYQADLLGKIDENGEARFDVIQELRRATDLSLWATKEMAKTIARSMAAQVTTERHLWLDLSDIYIYILYTDIRPTFSSGPLQRLCHLSH